jgi:hypothetical protein
MNKRAKVKSQKGINSIHKPPRPVGMRIEKVLPLPGENRSLI